MERLPRKTTGYNLAMFALHAYQPKNIKLFDYQRIVQWFRSMNDAVLQILLILTYLAIGLISITFPIYAIAVNYLPSEKWESEKERKTRIERLRNSINELNKELSGEEDSKRFAEIKRQIENYEAEKESLELKVRYLTAKGAVRNPIIGLVMALLASGAGIIFFYEGNQHAYIAICGSVSGLICSWALFNLYKTISAVEHSALRPARTIGFKICFDSGEKIQEIKRGEETEISIGACAEEQVEKFHMAIGLPTEIELKQFPTSERVTVSHQPKGAVTFPGFTAVFLEVDIAHSGIFQAIGE